jgi:hyperosmotically inducible periplasmic protein
MNLKIVASSLIVMSTLVAPAVFAQDSDADRSHPKAFVKDSVITTKVKSKLAAEHLGTLAHIRVDTDKDGVVWLSGTAPTREAADRAADIARSTEGVAAVKSDIKVRTTD